MWSTHKVWEVIPCLEKSDSMCDQFCHLYNLKNLSEKGTVTTNLNYLLDTGRFNLFKVTEPMNGRSAMRQSDSVVWFFPSLLACWGRHNKIGTDIEKHCVIVESWDFILRALESQWRIIKRVTQSAIQLRKLTWAAWWQMNYKEGHIGNWSTDYWDADKSTALGEW